MRCSGSGFRTGGGRATGIESWSSCHFQAASGAVSAGWASASHRRRAGWRGTAEAGNSTCTARECAGTRWVGRVSGVRRVRSLTATRRICGPWSLSFPHVPRIPCFPPLPGASSCQLPIPSRAVVRVFPGSRGALSSMPSSRAPEHARSRSKSLDPAAWPRQDHHCCSVITC